MYRNFNRINIILNYLKKIWLKNPDLRLMQLLLNVCGDKEKYYIEDDELVELLKETYKIKYEKFKQFK